MNRGPLLRGRGRRIRVCICVKLGNHRKIIEKNLVNSKYLGLEVLFRIISSWNYRAMTQKYMTPKMIIRGFSPLNISFGCIKAPNVSDYIQLIK